VGRIDHHEDKGAAEKAEAKKKRLPNLVGVGVGNPRPRKKKGGKEKRVAARALGEASFRNDTGKTSKPLMRKHTHGGRDRRDQGRSASDVQVRIGVGCRARTRRGNQFLRGEGKKEGDYCRGWQRSHLKVDRFKEG